MAGADLAARGGLTTLFGGRAQESARETATTGAEARTGTGPAGGATEKAADVAGAGGALMPAFGAAWPSGSPAEAAGHAIPLGNARSASRIVAASRSIRGRTAPSDDIRVALSMRQATSPCRRARG